MNALLPFFLTYLMVSLLAMLMLIPLAIQNRKGQLMSNKRLIVTVLIGRLVLALPGFFGLINLWFMWEYYVLNGFISLMLGVVFLRYLLHDLGLAYETRPLFVVLVTLVIVTLGMALFSYIFNFFSTLDYGLWAVTCLLPFIAPMVFSYAYAALVAVPNEIYGFDVLRQQR